MCVCVHPKAIKIHGSESRSQTKSIHRTHDTTVCYMHERSILIEHLIKACFEKLPYEKVTRVTKTVSYH